jgi:hypothetical protein
MRLRRFLALRHPHEIAQQPVHLAEASLGVLIIPEEDDLEAACV